MLAYLLQYFLALTVYPCSNKQRCLAEVVNGVDIQTLQQVHHQLCISCLNYKHSRLPDYTENDLSGRKAKDSFVFPS